MVDILSSVGSGHIFVGGKKMAISFQFVTIMVADDVCSRARESAYSTREETCPLESNRLSDC